MVNLHPTRHMFAPTSSRPRPRSSPSAPIRVKDESVVVIPSARKTLGGRRIALNVSFERAGEEERRNLARANAPLPEPIWYTPDDVNKVPAGLGQGMSPGAPRDPAAPTVAEKVAVHEAARVGQDNAHAAAARAKTSALSAAEAAQLQAHYRKIIDEGKASQQRTADNVAGGEQARARHDYKQSIASAKAHAASAERVYRASVGGDDIGAMAKAYQDMVRAENAVMSARRRPTDIARDRFKLGGREHPKWDDAVAKGDSPYEAARSAAAARKTMKGRMMARHSLEEGTGGAGPSRPPPETPARAPASRPAATPARGQEPVNPGFRGEYFAPRETAASLAEQLRARGFVIEPGRNGRGDQLYHPDASRNETPEELALIRRWQRTPHVDAAAPLGTPASPSGSTSTSTSGSKMPDVDANFARIRAHLPPTVTDAAIREKMEAGFWMDVRHGFWNRNSSRNGRVKNPFI